MASKLGQKKVQKVHHKDVILKLACLLKLVDLVQNKRKSQVPFAMETPNKCSLPNQNRVTSVKFDQFCFNNLARKGMVVEHPLVNFGRSQQGGLEERIINNDIS